MTRRDVRFTAQTRTTAVAESRRIAGFSSPASDLATLPHSQAKDLRGDHLSCTSLLFHEDLRELAGYFALVNDVISLKAAEPSINLSTTTEGRR
jgi:hypothetical protein